MKEPIVSFSDFDVNQVLVDRDGVMKVNPHRFELQLLDGILYLGDDHAVGYLDVKEDAFWVRGHFPQKPLMPGIVMCEAAAQLSSYFAISTKMTETGFIGLGGFDSVRFRGPVVPGDKLVMMLYRKRYRKNQMFTADFQCYVDRNLVVEGEIRGVALGDFT